MLALALFASANAAPQITAELIEVKDVQVGLSGASFTAMVQLTRESGPPMVLKDLDYDIVFNDEVIGGAGALPDKVRLPKGEPVVVELPGEITGGGNALIRAASSGRLDVRITGDAKVRSLLIPRTVPFDTEILRVE